MIEFATKQDVYPNFTKIVDIVSAQNPLQKKSIRNFVNRQDERYWDFAENLCKQLRRSYLTTDEEWAEAARSYNCTCKEILHLQIRFQETGVYPTENAGAANENVYSQDSKMRAYIVGLLFSYLFWPNHYQMFAFFQDHLAKISVSDCLEVGVGHGLFTTEVKHLYPNAKMTWIDISKTSLELATDMLGTFDIDPAEVHAIHGDYLKTDLGNQKFDFLIMGEVLEHVDDAPGFMARAYQLLRPGGRIFMSTCANCPAVDHVYHFHNINEIRSLVRDARLTIVDDLALPADPVDESEWEKKLVTVNYCGIFGRE